MEFNPTTTRSALLANNTSASDSFLGWPNGVAKPAAIGLASMNIPQKFRFVHRVNWWGTGNRTGSNGIGYASGDPSYISKTIKDMLQRGYNGASLLWNGSTYPEAKATLAMSKAFAGTGIVFIPMMASANPAFHLPPTRYPDVTVAQRTAAVIKELDMFRTTFFSLQSQFRINGRPVMQFFGVTGVDWSAIVDHLKTFGADQPLLLFRWENDGKYGNRKEADGYFGWRSCNEAWVKGVEAYGKLVMLGCNAGFDSSHKEPPVNCTWGNTDPRPQLNGLRRIQQLELCAAHPEITMMQECTWDDYQEGSPIEPGIATGIKPVITFTNGPDTLSWIDPGAMFDHLVMYAGKVEFPDDIMPVSGELRGVTSIALNNLGLPIGTYAFHLLAVGKNSIQHAISDPLIVGEVTDWQ